MSPPENAPADPPPRPYGTVPHGGAPAEPSPTPPVATPSVAEPSRGLAALAALLPVVCTTFCCVLFAVSTGSLSTLAQQIREMGTMALLAIVASVGTAVLGTTVLLFLSGRGWRVPSVIAVGLAALPWATGLLGAAYGISVARSAVQYADASSRATMMARGISEAINARSLGACLASGLLAAVAVGLAIGALAQRAPGRRPWVGAAGLVASLPLLGLTYSVSGVGLPGVLLPTASLCAALAVALGGAGVGTDAAHGRSGALASAAAVAAGLSVAAAVATASSAAISEAFYAVASMDYPSRGTRLRAAAADLYALEIFALSSTVLALLTAAAIAAWAVVRVRPSPGRIAGAVAIVLTFGLLNGLDAWGVRAGATVFADLTEPPWHDVPDLVRVAVPDHWHRGDVDGLATPRGLLRPDGSPVAPLEASALTEGLRALGGAAVRGYREEDTPVWLREEDVDDGARAPEPPPLTLILDARLSALQLQALFGAAREYGARSLILAGERPDGLTTEEREEVAERLPMMASIVGGSGNVRVFLTPGPGIQPERDPVLRHVTVGATPPRRVETRPGADVSDEDRALFIEQDTRGRYLGEDRPLLVALGPDATARSLMETVGAAQSRGYGTIVVPGAIPGRPEEPLGFGGSNFGFGGVGLGNNLGAIGGDARAEDATAGRVTIGRTDVRGSLEQEVVVRTVRRHLRELRFCYQQELQSAPELEGNLTMSFIISATGAVQSAAVNHSTLDRPRMDACLANGLRRWTFPAPDGGGVVGVTLPLTLSPELE